MKIKPQIKFHCDNRKLCKIYRKVGGDTLESNTGYVINYSKEFVLMQEVDDFLLRDYVIFPIAAISEISYGYNERYYNKIMSKEKLVPPDFKKYNVDLTSWTTVFKTIKEAGFNVIIENEDPADKTFDIGPIIRTTDHAVYIRYFNSLGYLDKEPTKIPFTKITLAKFDSLYINIFAKHLRARSSKSEK